VRESEAITWHLHKKLVCGERLRCAKGARLESIHGDRSNELICLGLSKAAGELAARKPILSAINLCAPEPLGNARLTNPRRGIDLCAAVKASNNEVEELQVREKRSDTGLQKKTPQRRNSLSHRPKVDWPRCPGFAGGPASHWGTSALECVECPGPLLRLADCEDAPLRGRSLAAHHPKQRGHIAERVIRVEAIETVDDDEGISAGVLPEQFGERMPKLK
jgi:hypothetical protein